MKIQKLLKEKNMSVSLLSTRSGVPYATCRDIVSGKADLKKCAAGTVFHIAEALGVSMESILGPHCVDRPSFENFKSEICHRVKRMGDKDFIIHTLENDDIRRYFDWEWYPESLYLLAMLDYISRENDVPLCIEYDDLRRCKMQEIIYPLGIITMAVVSQSDEPYRKAERECIPEFMRHNIIEAEIRNVV